MKYYQIYLFLLLFGSWFSGYGQSSSQNYIKTDVVCKSGQTTEAQVNALGYQDKQTSFGSIANNLRRNGNPTPFNIYGTGTGKIKLKSSFNSGVNTEMPWF
ncbi:hypothetical protein EYV94_27570 [Puteibacter caeruleilacunae]|nr:hypothetical protein EYV94_27570 [Puteibacter caeruleilacunae]